MKTSFTIPDCTETKSQKNAVHGVTGIDTTKKINAHKKRILTFLATFAITFGAFLMTACDEESNPCTNCPPPPLPLPTTMLVRGTFPSAGAPGSTVAIYGENFDASTSDKHV